MNLNKAIIVGRITADPELKAIPSGTKVTNFSVATSRKWTDKAGAKTEATEFHKVVAFGRIAEIIGQYCKKGSLLLVEGRLQTRKWQAKDGTDRYSTEILAESIQLGPRPQTATSLNNTTPVKKVEKQTEAERIADAGFDVDPGPMSENLPF